MWEAAGRDAVARHGPWDWVEDIPLSALATGRVGEGQGGVYCCPLFGVLSEAEGTRYMISPQ